MQPDWLCPRHEENTYETADQRLLLGGLGAGGAGAGAAEEAAVLDFLAGPLAAAPDAALFGGMV